MKKLRKDVFILCLSVIVSIFVACSDGGDADSNGAVSTDNAEIEVMKPVTDAISDTASETETSGANTTESDTITITETESDSESLSPETEEIPDDTVTVKYIALGDSIAYGYGLSDIESERYPTLIADFIDGIYGYKADVYNYAVSGDKSSDLIELIEDGGTPELADADIVTVSIGANNVLAPATEKLAQYYLFSSIQDENLRDMELPRIYNELMSETSSGIRSFERDISRIIELIKRSAPNAEIIFQTIYNPYRNVDITLDFAGTELILADETDRLVTSLNNIITDYATALGYETVDIYSAINAHTDVINADSFDGSDDDYATIFISADPHPNAKGHRVIADAMIQKIKLP